MKNYKLIIQFKFKISNYHLYVTDPFKIKEVVDMDYLIHYSTTPILNHLKSIPANFIK